MHFLELYTYGTQIFHKKHFPSKLKPAVAVISSKDMKRVLQSRIKRSRLRMHAEVFPHLTEYCRLRDWRRAPEAVGPRNTRQRLQILWREGKMEKTPKISSKRIVMLQHPEMDLEACSRKIYSSFQNHPRNLNLEGTSIG